MFLRKVGEYGPRISKIQDEILIGWDRTIRPFRWLVFEYNIRT